MMLRYRQALWKKKTLQYKLMLLNNYMLFKMFLIVKKYFFRNMKIFLRFKNPVFAETLIQAVLVLKI